MKKLFLILTVFITSLFANHVFWQPDYDRALAKARDENKTLMVFLIKSNCEKCKTTVSKVFTNKPYIDKLNKHVVSVIVDLDTKHSFPREMYWSNSYPTLFFVDSKTETFIHKPLSNDINEKNIKKVLSKIEAK